MDKHDALYERIKGFSLFAGLDRAQILFLLTELDAQWEAFEKGAVIARLSGTISSFALILRGSLELSQYDYWGNRSLLLTLETGDNAGLPSALFERWTPPAEIAARSRCELLFFDAQKLRAPDLCTAPACLALKDNIAKQLALKNAALIRKISLINLRSTREKVSLFLSKKAAQCCSSSFDIEFTRQEMADFLSVNRCALSKELARMRDDGLIEFSLNHFTLKKLAQADPCL